MCGTKVLKTAKVQSKYRFLNEYGPIWAILATHDEIWRARFGPLWPYSWS